MIGQSVGSDANPLSCFLFRPRKSCEKRRKRSHTNISDASVTRTSTPPAQTSQRSFQGAAVGTHATPAPNRAHSGLHAETGSVSDGALSLPSTRAARSRTSPGRVSERQTLPLLGLGRRHSQRTQRACGTAMRSCASLFRGVAAPLGCADRHRPLSGLCLLRYLPESNSCLLYTSRQLCDCPGDKTLASRLLCHIADFKVCCPRYLFQVYLNLEDIVFRIAVQWQLSLSEIVASGDDAGVLYPLKAPQILR